MTIEVQEPIKVEKPPTPKRVKPLNRPQLLLYGVQQEALEPVKRYIALLGLGDILITTGMDETHQLLAKDAEYYDLVIFDFGLQADIALPQLMKLQCQIGKRVIFLGGNAETSIDSATLAQCRSEGLLYYASKPIDFKQLANAIVKFYDANKISYKKRERKSSNETRSGRRVSVENRETNVKAPPRRRSLEQPRASPRQRKLTLLSNLFGGKKGVEK